MNSSSHNAWTDPLSIKSHAQETMYSPLLNFSLRLIEEANGTESNILNVPPLYRYYPILVLEMGLSIVCSLALIIVYIITGEHRTVPGKNVMTISSCLIVTYILLIADLSSRDSISFPLCKIIGIIVQTSFLATFFWTNVLAYDVMKTISSINTKSSRIEYWKYSVYAWVSTSLCVVPAIVLDCTDLVPGYFRPNFGVEKCWLTGQEAYLIYFNAPVGMTLASNCVFFLMTARTIVEVRSATAILEATRLKKRLRLCIKLVLVMGLVWITEFIPWLTGIYFLYAVAGLLNCLHGVYLFLIFACKKRIFMYIFSSGQFCKGKKLSTKNKQKSSSIDTIVTLAA